MIDGEKILPEFFSNNIWPLIVSIKMAELAESPSCGVQAYVGILLNNSIKINIIKHNLWCFFLICSPQIISKEYKISLIL
jgi:hypothetical protein